MIKNGISPLLSALFCTACLSLALFSSLSSAEVYKWVDEHGKVHFGDRPPNRDSAEEISNTLQELNVSTDYSSPEMIQRMEQQQREQQKQAYQRQAKQIKSYESEVQNWCREAKTRLHNLQGRVRFYDEAGNDVYVSESERKEREASLKAEIEKNCN